MDNSNDVPTNETKDIITNDVPTNETKDVIINDVKQKRGRGRPRTKILDENAIKRPVGRPKKVRFDDGLPKEKKKRGRPIGIPTPPESLCKYKGRKHNAVNYYHTQHQLSVFNQATCEFETHEKTYSLHELENVLGFSYGTIRNMVLYPMRISRINKLLYKIQRLDVKA